MSSPSSTTLPTAAFGNTGLEVTRLGYGAMELRGTRIWGGRPVTESQAERMLNSVLDAGINFIDTSNDYGRSEEFIGRFISNRRNEYLLCTKCGCKVTRRDEQTDDTPHEWTRANLVRGLHESLGRLQTHSVDVLLLHNPTVADIEQGDLVACLQEFKAQRLVRHIGISTTLPELPKCLELGVFEVYEIPYSGLDRKHEAWITQAAEAGAGIIVRGGVARGEPGSGLGSSDRWRVWERAGLDDLRGDDSPTAFLLRHTLSHPHAHTIIVGTMKVEHLAENLAAVREGPLPNELYAEVNRRLADAGEAPEAVG